MPDAIDRQKAIEAVDGIEVIIGDIKEALIEVDGAYNVKTTRVIYDTLDWVKKRIRSLPAVQTQGWISVKERLPESEGEYLIYAKDQEHLPNIVIDEYKLTRKKWVYKCPYFRYESPVTHWMPLPHSPQTQEGEDG